MGDSTFQLKQWTGKFGKEYTDRNVLSLNELDKLYKDNYGITRKELNKLFLDKIDCSARILEVGSNVGNQLLMLKKMGFKNLYGIELQDYAIEYSKKRTKGINIIRGSVFDIPFKDGYFDMVFTSGLLIHINPSDLRKAMTEIHRCCSRYIWGFEYYSEDYKKIVYRGHKNLLWKANFPKIYTDTFSDLKVIEIKFLKYLENDNVDIMFLLEKTKKRADIRESVLVIHEPALRGDTIYLEGLTEKHVSEKYVQWLNDQEICRHNRHGRINNNLQMTMDYVRSVDESPNNAAFAIMTKKENKHIGNISLNDISWENRSGEISIIIGEKDYWGRGIATEAYRLIINYGFNMLNLHRLKSGMSVRNKAMIRVAEKVGMVKEGIFKEAFFKDGEYIDIVQYTIINSKQKTIKKVKL